MLVAADVQGPDREPAAAEGVGDGPVAGELFGLAGGLVPVEEEEFGAQQPDAVGAVSDCGGGVVGRGDVGGDLDVTAVGGDRGPRRRLLQRFVATARGARRVRGSAATVCGTGSNSTTPAVPSTTTVVPSATASTSAPAATTIGIPSERARIAPWETGAAGGGDDGGHPEGSSAAASIGLRSGATTTPSTSSNDSGAVPLNCASNLAAHGVDVGGAGSLIRVGEGGEPVGDASTRLPPRILGGHGALVDEPGEAVLDELVGVVEQEEVGVEDGGLVLAWWRGRLVARGLQLVARLARTAAMRRARSSSGRPTTRSVVHDGGRGGQRGDFGSDTDPRCRRHRPRRRRLVRRSRRRHDG